VGHLPAPRVAAASLIATNETGDHDALTARRIRAERVPQEGGRRRLRQRGDQTADSADPILSGRVSVRCGANSPPRRHLQRDAFTGAARSGRRSAWGRRAEGQTTSNLRQDGIQVGPPAEKGRRSIQTIRWFRDTGINAIDDNWIRANRRCARAITRRPRRSRPRRPQKLGEALQSATGTSRPRRADGTFPAWSRVPVSPLPASARDGLGGGNRDSSTVERSARHSRAHVRRDGRQHRRGHRKRSVLSRTSTQFEATVQLGRQTKPALGIVGIRLRGRALAPRKMSAQDRHRCVLAGTPEGEPGNERNSARCSRGKCGGDRDVSRHPGNDRPFVMASPHPSPTVGIARATATDLEITAPGRVRTPPG